jgi:ubiquinone/menaquinone biosynthesis C-methylase UbiE
MTTSPSSAKAANVVYHDWEAESYDAKWSISFDERCIEYARHAFDSASGRNLTLPVGLAVEIGAGTGFFLLNLMQSGVAHQGLVTDISSGMVRTAVRHAGDLGLNVTGAVADAESLPIADASCDLVVGHAVLHHIPYVERAMTEVLRILRPGGVFVITGEPTDRGDFVARRLSRLTWWVTSRVTQAPVLRERWARPPEELTESSEAAALEAVVDLHTFDPDELARTCLRAGAVDVRTHTSEFTASWFGWPVRTFESAVKPGALGFGWSMFAYRTWQGLARLDESVLARVVPDGFFYNVSVSGVKP